MGLPVHYIRPEFHETWIDSLRNGLSGYATVESVDDPSEGTIVYIVGDHGCFTIYTGNSPFWLMFPFLCTAKREGQNMVNLEERIHRVLDEMRVAFTPEYIERYEKSRWTKFFRLFGWEHVGSLDFAHRPKVEILEGDFSDPEPISGFRRKYYVRCKPDVKGSWPEILQRRLGERAVVHLISAPPRTIVSPNGKLSMETPTMYEIKAGKKSYFMQFNVFNDIYLLSLQGEFSGTRIDRARKQLCTSLVGRIINDTLREISFEK